MWSFYHHEAVEPEVVDTLSVDILEEAEGACARLEPLLQLVGRDKELNRGGGQNLGAVVFDETRQATVGLVESTHAPRAIKYWHCV